MATAVAPSAGLPADVEKRPVEELLARVDARAYATRQGRFEKRFHDFSDVELLAAMLEKTNLAIELTQRLEEIETLGWGLAERLEREDYRTLLHLFGITPDDEAAA